MTGKNVEEATARLKAQGAKFLGSTESIFAECDKIANVNFDVMTFAKNEVLTIPSMEEMPKNFFVMEMGRNKKPCPGVVTAEGKQLFLSSLKKSVALYDDEVHPTGESLTSNTKLAEDCRAKGTYKGILELIAGKKLVVADKLSGTTARFNFAGEIIGTKNGTVACFDYKA